MSFFLTFNALRPVVASRASNHQNHLVRPKVYKDQKLDMNLPSLASLTGVHLIGTDSLTFPNPIPKGSARHQCHHYRLSSSWPLASQCHTPPDAHVPSLPPQAKEPTFPMAPSRAGVNLGRTLSNCDAIISIGLNTDAALDRLGLEDRLIPKLYSLIATVRNTRWEAELQG